MCSDRPMEIGPRGSGSRSFVHDIRGGPVSLRRRDVQLSYDSATETHAVGRCPECVRVRFTELGQNSIYHDDGEISSRPGLSSPS
jgi:hypothetical protein